MLKKTSYSVKLTGLRSGRSGIETWRQSPERRLSNRGALLCWFNKYLLMNNYIWSTSTFDSEEGRILGAAPALALPTKSPCVRKPVFKYTEQLPLPSPEEVLRGRAPLASNHWDLPGQH